jgi:hypothetical protein
MYQAFYRRHLNLRGVESFELHTCSEQRIRELIPLMKTFFSTRSEFSLIGKTTGESSQLLSRSNLTEI